MVWPATTPGVVSSARAAVTSTPAATPEMALQARNALARFIRCPPCPCGSLRRPWLAYVIVGHAPRSRAGVRPDARRRATPGSDSVRVLVRTNRHRASTRGLLGGHRRDQ